MKAVVYTQYGPPEVLHVQEMDKPVPGAKEVLVKIYAASVNYGDLTGRNFKNIPARQFHMSRLLWFPAKLMFGLNKPRQNVLGSEFSGRIESVGAEVKKFKAGDEVFGYRGQSMGAYAQYLCMPESATLALKPVNISNEEAAVIPYGAIMSLNLLKKVNIQSGQKVLINGASGSIGSFAVQFAKYYGADVTGVCGTPRIDFVKALGADKVIDYRKEDFTRNNEKYDIIFDVLGKSSFAKCKKVLNENGRYLLASFKLKQLWQMLQTKLAGNKRVICALSVDKPENLEFIRELVEKEKIKSIVDRIFEMEQAAEAHRYVESGEKKGSIVISMNHRRT
jgi:NADPH:quinone reductase-like Zn-dependent oxidoreductase